MDYFDIAVIGGGPGGCSAAAAAAKKGYSTVMIEKAELGGTCLNRGCIPTKSLLQGAELYQHIQSAHRWGLSAENPMYHMDRMQLRAEEVVTKLREDLRQTMHRNHVCIKKGRGQIEAPGQIHISGGQDETVMAGKILIASGSVPAVPPIPGVLLPGVMTSNEFLKEKKVYDRLVIIGGGVIGIEFASLYAMLGRQTTILEAAEKILPGMDKEISQSVRMMLRQRGCRVHTGAFVEKIETSGGGLVCFYEENGVSCSTEADAVLLAVGRRADTQGLIRENMIIETEKGCIKINGDYETNLPGIYAAGDVTGGIQLAHKAAAEGENAVCCMLGEKAGIYMKTVPSCIYTYPEIASAGFTEEEARNAGILKIIKKKYPMTGNCRTVIADGGRGFIKVIADGETGRILGAQIMCLRATDIIGEMTVAINQGMTLGDMSSIIRPHPTFEEGITEAVRE